MERLNKLLPLTLFLSGLLIYYLVGIIFALISFSRSSSFIDNIENFPPDKGTIVLLSFIFLLFSYLLLIFSQPKLQLKMIFFLIVPLLLLFYLTPPFASLDAASYMIIAKNFIDYGLNPYLNNIGNIVNPWGQQLGHIWWLNYPSPYGPIFLLITIPAVIFKNMSLIGAIYIYKFIVLICYFLNIYFLYLLSAKNNRMTNIIYYGLNPGILFNLIIEGHNEIFISLGILISCYLWQQNKIYKSFAAFLITFFIKFNSLIFFPIYWFNHKKFKLKLTLIYLSLSAISFFVYLALFNLNIDIFLRNISFINKNCIYSCSPFILITKNLFKENRFIIMFFSFISIYLLIIYRDLYYENNIYKFIFWSFIGFALTAITWLTPWYLLLIVPVALLTNEKKYQMLVYLITVYSLLHYIGI